MSPGPFAEKINTDEGGLPQSPPFLFATYVARKAVADWTQSLALLREAALVSNRPHDAPLT